MYCQQFSGGRPQLLWVKITLKRLWCVSVHSMVARTDTCYENGHVHATTTPRVSPNANLLITGLVLHSIVGFLTAHNTFVL